MSPEYGLIATNEHELFEQFRHAAAGMLGYALNAIDLNKTRPEQEAQIRNGLQDYLDCNVFIHDFEPDYESVSAALTEVLSRESATTLKVVTMHFNGESTQKIRAEIGAEETTLNKIAELAQSVKDNIIRNILGKIIWRQDIKPT